MRPSQLLAAVAALSSLSAAMPDAFELPYGLSGVRDVLYGRQDKSDSAQSTDAAKTTDAPKSTDDASQTGKATATATKDDDSKTSGKASGSNKATKTTGKPKATNFGADVPAGGVQMVTPSAIAGSQFYKIGDWVTFAWNYTSLSVTPSAIDVMATCSQNQATYTIAVNQSVQETGKVLWDTGAYQSQHLNDRPLLMATYTLLIYDAESSVSATAKPGYLSTYQQFTFGMYSPQPYVPWSEFKCANCNPNGALSAFEALTLKALLITSATTIGSLLYFAASFGVW